MTNNVYIIDLIESIERLHYKYRTEFGIQLAPHGVTPTEASLLLLLASSETAPSLKEIGAAQTADTPPSRLLRSLRDRKLVRQTRDKLDERIWRFTLTAQGKRMADVVQKCKVDLAKQWGRDLSKGSLGPTVKLLRQLSTGL